MSTPKVALITGGASGIGLATATAIGQRGGWEVHVLDYNPAAAAAVRDGVPGGVFHAVDVTDYAALGAAFQTVFRRHRRIDFVFANAGIAEPMDEFYEGLAESAAAADAAAAADGSTATAVDDTPPHLPGHTTRVIDVVFTAATTTAFLAQHYLARSPPADSLRCLVLTASCGGLYPSYGSPVYSAAKHAVVGLARSIAPVAWRRARVRANAVLPGTVRTNLLTGAQWASFPDAFFTPVATIVRAVLILLDGADAARPDRAGPLVGQCIECSVDRLYYRDQYPYCDDAMAAVMKSTDLGK